MCYGEVKYESPGGRLIRSTSTPGLSPRCINDDYLTPWEVCQAEWVDTFPLPPLNKRPDFDYSAPSKLRGQKKPARWAISSHQPVKKTSGTNTHQNGCFSMD